MTANFWRFVEAVFFKQYNKLGSNGTGTYQLGTVGYRVLPKKLLLNGLVVEAAKIHSIVVLNIKIIR